LAFLRDRALAISRICPWTRADGGGALSIDPYSPPQSSLSPRAKPLGDLGSLAGYRFPFTAERAGFLRRRLDLEDATGRVVASVSPVIGFLKFPFDLEWEDETVQRFEQRRSFFAIFHPYELWEGDRVHATYEQVSAGCFNLLRSWDWLARTSSGAQCLVRRRMFGSVDRNWPALESGEFLTGRVDYQVQVGTNQAPLFTAVSGWFGVSYTIHRFAVTATPEEERLALTGLLLALAHRHLRGS
jgi:hypothetical protein